MTKNYEKRVSLGAVHTYTHTHTPYIYRNSTKNQQNTIIVNNSEKLEFICLKKIIYNFKRMKKHVTHITVST